jgi:hypothetical protein
MKSLFKLKVNLYHNKMVLWMVEALIYLTPDRSEISQEARLLLYKSLPSVAELEQNGYTLIESANKFTESLCE